MDTSCPLRFLEKFSLLPEEMVFKRSFTAHSSSSSSSRCESTSKPSGTFPLSPSSSNGVGEDSFVKDAQWSPDGSAIMSVVNSDTMAFFTVDTDLVRELAYYEESNASSSTSSSSSRNAKTCIGTDSDSGLSALSRCTLGSTVINAQWYPFMHASDPSTCCYITACRDKPIHLWSYDPTGTCANTIDHAFTPNPIPNPTPTSRCSYRCYNHYDEIDTPQAVSFNVSGEKIYACSRNLIRVFDVNRPGRECESLPTVRFKKDRYSMFKGLISSVEFAPDPNIKVYSCGTFSNNVAVFVEGTPESVLMLLDVPVGNGITCQKWSPDGNNLWVGGRNGSDIICYDLRSTRSELGRVKRNLISNQRISFDLDPWGKYLATGSQDVEILIYNTNDFSLHCSMGSTATSTDAEAHVDVDMLDCTNSVQFHPYSSMLCTSTGQRQFFDNDSDSYSDSDSNSDVESSDRTISVSNKRKGRGRGRGKENTRRRGEREIASSVLRLIQVGCERLPHPTFDD